MLLSKTQLNGLFKLFCMLSLTPLSHQTAMPQRLYSVLNTCQCDVGSPRNTPKTIKFASYSVYTTFSQRPCSVHMAFPQRLYCVHGASTKGASSCCSVFTARPHRAHGALMASTQRSHCAHTTFSSRS